VSSGAKAPAAPAAGVKTKSKSIDESHVAPRAEKIRKAAKTLGERAERMRLRVRDDGAILGMQGMCIDLKWARDLLEEIETELSK